MLPDIGGSPLGDPDRGVVAGGVLNPLPLTARGGAERGGGGVAPGEAVGSSLPAFLLTHRFRSGS